MNNVNDELDNKSGNTPDDDSLKETLSLFNIGYKNEAINLIECGKESCMPNKNYFPSIRDYFTIHYITHGSGFLYLEKRTIELKAGDIFIIIPNQTQKYLPSSSTPWSYYWVGLQGTIIDKVMILLGINANKPYIRGEKDRYIADLFEQITDSFIKSNFLHLKPLAYCELLLSYLIEKNVSVSKIVLSQKQLHIKEAQEFISCNYKQQFTVKELAASLNLNSNYLSNIFNEVLNISTKQYIINYRIQKACEFLETNNYSVKEVAELVGYSDSMHFSKEFKRIKKISPLQYKKKNIT